MLVQAKIALPHLLQQSYSLTWLVVAYGALGCIANAVTPSKRERNIWLPVGVSMLALSLVFALS